MMSSHRRSSSAGGRKRGGLAIHRLAWIFGLLLSSSRCQAERMYEELAWSSSLCSELGHDGDFDTCAMIEFCRGEGRKDEWSGRRLLRREGGYFRNGGDEFEKVEQVDAMTASATSESESNNSPAVNVAEYGWRVPGSACTWPGPLMRLTRGVKHGLFVRGSSSDPDERTNLHLHGLHVPGHGNGDDVSRSVRGDDVIIYNVTVPEYHMGGTFWYHSHHHGASDKQVSGGAFGMAIVDDGADVGTDDSGVLKFLSDNERMLVLDNKVGSWVANGIAHGEDDYALRIDEWYRLRILMVNVDSHKSGGTVRFPDECEVRSIAHDGVFRFSVPSADSKSEYFLTGSSRLDVAIQCTEGGGISVDGDSVAKIELVEARDGDDGGSVAASPFERGSDAWSSNRPSYLADLRDMNVDNNWRIKLGETKINDMGYSSDRPNCLSDGEDFQYGTLQEWEVRGANTHPLHIHVFPMQIVSDGCGPDHEVGEFYDSLVVNSFDRSKKCLVRVRLVDVSGKIVLHCHIFEHEDHGAMGYLNVVGGPVQPDEPRVFACESMESDGKPCDEPRPATLCKDR